MPGHPSDQGRASDAALTLFQWAADLHAQRPSPDNDDVDPITQRMIKSTLGAADDLLTSGHNYHKEIQGLIKAESWSLRTIPAILNAIAKALCIAYDLNDRGEKRRSRELPLQTPTKPVTVRLDLSDQHTE